ncbi:MAG: glutathione S-transferase family protein [Gammaproteobacteria bacterium]
MSASAAACGKGAAALVLHHYDFSNYSEKVRLVLGLKGLAWRSVTIPAWAPKPDYTPLTAGYRRTPALQLGADVYCDTALIVEVLEARAPRPTLYPGDDPPRVRALTAALVHWAEVSLCRPLALYITGRHAARFPPEFHADRARLHGRPLPSLAQVEASAAKYQAQVAPQLAHIEALLGDGRAWILGDAPGLADLALYEGPWFLHTIGGAAALPAGLPRLRAWMARVAALGHGTSQPLSAADALAMARAATPCAVRLTPGAEAPEGVRVGDDVVVRPLDEDAPARGRLAALDRERITLAIDSAASGPVHVHFPRLGYRLGRARG